MTSTDANSHQDDPQTTPTPWTPPRVGICIADEHEQMLYVQAQSLANFLRSPIVSCDDVECDLHLLVTPDGFELYEVGSTMGGVKIDFADSADTTRRLATASKKQPLAKAIGLQKRTPTVVDATAGLGRDAMQLATLGCHVTAIERSPVLAVMLRDALQRLAADDALPDHIALIYGNAVDIVEHLTDDPPDVVYMDPMYPHKNKSALPKKEMVILRRLVGDDDDAAALFEAAKSIAKNRVVVKRPPHAPELSPNPSMSIKSKMTRYDVYLTEGLRPNMIA